MLKRRDVELDLDPKDVPRDWCYDNAFTTTFLNALSLLFPEGEKFFVDSVKKQRAKIEDPALLADIQAFIGQEAMHGKEHRAFNDLMIEHGYDEAPIIDGRLRKFLGFIRKTLPPMSQLAATTALEHFTAMLAEQLLADERMHDDVHESVRPLWLWHALEESEHKAVAFDVYTAAGGGYARRVLIMLATTAIFFSVQALVHARLMATRKILWKPWRWVRGATRLWIYPGYLTRLVPAYLAYFKPGFHPNERDTNELLRKWETQLFGATGQLRDRLAS
jgi:predicted metal-dependent hydrolase